MFAGQNYLFVQMTDAKHCSKSLSTLLGYHLSIQSLKNQLPTHLSMNDRQYTNKWFANFDWKPSVSCWREDHSTDNILGEVVGVQMIIKF